MYEVSLGQCNLNVALDYHLSQGVTYRALSNAVHSDSQTSILPLEETLRRQISSRGCPSNLAIFRECWTGSMGSVV
jgi:hypothetical protein